MECFWKRAFQTPSLSLTSSWIVEKWDIALYDSSSRLWNWSRLPFSLLKCEVAGLLYDSDSNCVFNVHTRVFHKLPSLPEPASNPLEEDEGVPRPLIGMAVDTSVSPYSFQVILGHEDISTRIYDSRSGSWTHKPSKMSPAVASRVEDSKRKSTCAQCNGFLYFRVRDEVYMDLHIYNVEKDKWSLVPFSGPEDAFLFRDIGVWQDRVFLFAMMAYGPICAYEVVAIVDWMFFVQMDLPDLRLWMLAGEDYYMDEYERIEKIEMQCKFYGESVLVYSCVGLQDVTERVAELLSTTWTGRGGRKLSCLARCHPNQTSGLC